MPDSMKKKRQSAADVEAAFLGKPQPGGTYDPDDDGDDDSSQAPGQHGTGTDASGYMPADQGPFRCDHCQHFTPRLVGQSQQGADDAPGTCDQPEVKTDPEVRGRVQAGSCCSFFDPEQADPDAIAQGPGDEGAAPGNGAPGVAA